MSAGTQGWYTCVPISARRMGVPGPNGVGTTDGARYVVAVKLRPARRHKGYRSFWEFDEKFGSWTLMVFDDHRSVVGQVFGKTQDACHRKMNAIFADKGLGTYNGQYKP